MRDDTLHLVVFRGGTLLPSPVEGLADHELPLAKKKAPAHRRMAARRTLFGLPPSLSACDLMSFFFSLPPAVAKQQSNVQSPPWYSRGNTESGLANEEQVLLDSSMSKPSRTFRYPSLNNPEWMLLYTF